MSFDRLYHDDPVEDQKSRASGKISGLLALVLTIFGAGFYLQSTLAANVSLNSGGAIEFGQGSARTVACSEEQSLIITPLSSFTNSAGAGSHKFSSIKVTNIPTACRGQDFTFSAYNNVASSAAQAIFNTSSTRAVVHMKDDDTFEVGIYGTGLSVTTNSASSFTVTFTTPVVASSDVFNLTVESAAHTVVTCATGGSCQIGDIGPGGGKVFALASGSGSGLNYEFATNPVPSGGLSYSTFGNIAFKWCNLTTGTITGALGTAIGTGKQNTTDMVAACTSGAAVAARGYSANGFSDWFLPSTSELAAFRPTLTPIMTGKGWSGTERIWTSTQGGAGNANAWFIGLDGYTNAQDGKGQNYPVFPIRSWVG